MAPPPEYDKEPKAPDKSATIIPGDDSKALHNLFIDQQNSSDSKTASATANVEAENNKHVEHLDDGQLKALLDEAITYKRPKDREGKSSLFNELLEEVEQDEQAHEAAARELSGGRAARRVPRGGRRLLAHSNSLQDLEQEALAAECALRRVRHGHAAHAPHAPASVSARATHGGSLPSDVDKSFLLGEESCGRGGAGGGGYLATVRCVNPPPLNERRVSASDAHDHESAAGAGAGASAGAGARRSKPAPAFPMTYTARATLEIGSGSVGSGRAVTTTTASNQVDSAIPFNCITSSEVVDSCNTTTSTQSSVAEDAKPLQLGWGYHAVASLTGPPPAPPAPRASPPPPVPAPPTAARAPSGGDSTQPRSAVSSSFNGLPLARTNYGSTATTTSSDEYKKSLDENGNSLQGFSSPQSGSSHNKKPRRKKSSKNETVMTSHQIDGYKGDKDLNEVLRFIESRAERERERGRHKLPRAKHRDDASTTAATDKKRSAERSGRKDKESKVKRASSLEELSRTTLEDLTDAPPERERRAPGVQRAPRRQPAPAKPERRSWGDDARDAFYFRDETAPAPAAPHERDAPPDADFQTVTKKRKPRRRADEPEPEPQPPRAGPGVGAVRACTPRARRVSAPPSDRSADSNDDMDSVHSLPSLPQPPPTPAAPLPPPPISYADIARTRHNIPDLIESCNFYAEGEAGAAREAAAAAARETAGEVRARGDADGYPALEPRHHARRPRDVTAKPPAPAPAARSRDRKEAREVTRVPEPEPEPACPAGGAVGAVGAGGACPAPDVVADRRPPVILLDSAARPGAGDMDGVTFGFDINEQLLELGGSARRGRCDLVRDAVESDAAADKAEPEPAKPSPGEAPAIDAAVTKPVESAVKSPVEVAMKPVAQVAQVAQVAVAVAAARGVAVAAGCGALRWLPPRPPRDTHQLLQIVDYVGGAWEDVVRCGGGKVRYFSE